MRFSYDDNGRKAEMWEWSETRAGRELAKGKEWEERRWVQKGKARGGNEKKKKEKKARGLYLHKKKREEAHTREEVAEKECLIDISSKRERERTYEKGRRLWVART